MKNTEENSDALAKATQTTYPHAYTRQLSRNPRVSSLNRPINLIIGPNNMQYATLHWVQPHA
jgi:hypothetical protein